MNEPVLGVVLAGGLARRMGGGDKPLRRIGGRTILERVVARLRPQCDGLILNANGDPQRFAATALPVVPDDVTGFAGPLAGILAALDWAAANRPDLTHVVSAAGDSPFLPGDFVVRLQATSEASGHPLACAASGGRSHPVNGLWPVRLRHDLRHALTVEDERKVGRWTARHGVGVAEWSTHPIDPFFNANAPDDLADAEALLARYGDE